MIKILLDSLRNGSEFHRDFAGRTVAFLSGTLCSEAFIQKANLLCDQFADPDGAGPSYVDVVREWSAPGTVRELPLDIVLAVDLPGMPGQEPPPPPATGIVTPYWFIDDCIRRDDPAALGAQWVREWLIGTFREGEAGRAVPPRPPGFPSGNPSRPEFLLPPGLQALVDFAIGIHDAIRDHDRR